MSARPNSEGQAVFTIVSASYISLAATLMQSVRDHNPGAARFIVLVDAMQDFPGLDLAAELLPAEACGIAGFGNMALWYDVMELNTAVKPSVFLHLFGRGFGQVAYLDPDILVTAPLQPVWDGLDGHSCVLTPHHLQPLQDGRHPNDLAIMKSGVYNLGFLGLRNDEDAMRLARWWADRLLTGCRVDLPGHMFTDQRWMDLAPAFVPRTLILRHPGCNLAYWNLPHREVRGSAATGFTVDGQPLVFAHFSGIKPDDPCSFSKHQDRYTADTLPPAMAELCEEYRRRVMRNGWARTGALLYAYSRFPDGRRIEPLMRRWLLRTLDAGNLDPQEPVGIPSDYFDHPEDGAALGAPITRLMYQLWLDRLDLQTHFPVAMSAGAAAYRSWFLSGEAAVSGVDPRSIAAARRLGLPHSFPARQPPWLRVAGMVWSGPAAAAGGFLAEDVRFELDGASVLLSRSLALAWERRADLQHHFPLRDLGSLGAYVGWCLTSGLHDGVVAPDMISDGLVAWLTEVPLDAGPAGADVPLTRALMLTQGCTLGREVLPPASGFPGDRTARLSHALWFAYLAPTLLRWPDALAAPVRAWFARPSEVSAAGFTLNRAVLVLWWLRTDVAAAHPMFDESSRQDYLLWLLLDGLRELGLGVGDLDPALAQQLTQDVPRMPGVPWFAKLLHGCRADLRDSFDLATPAGRRGLAGWCGSFLQAEYGGTSAGRVMFPSALAAVPVRAALALTGCWTGQSGLGEFLRGTAMSLRRCGFDDFVVVDRLSSRMFRADGDPLPAGTTLHVDRNLVHLNAETAMEDWAWLRKLGVQSARTIGWWAWELEALPAWWMASYSYYDEVWGISAFTTAALARPGLRPVRTVPQPVHLPDGFVPAPRASFGLADGETVFLFMFDPHSFVERKNPQGVVRAFAQAFPGGDEPVRLIIKMHHGADFPELMATLKAASNDPRVEIRDEYMGREGVLGLIAAADAFVSLHRSEGFGRGPAEAMLLGKPVILTDYSGTQDFADASVALPVPCRLVPVAPDEYIGVEGQRWAEADVAAAAEHMRWVARNPAAARQLGLRARARIQAAHGAEAVGRQVLAALDLGDAERRPADVQRPARRGKRYETSPRAASHTAAE
jgi:glycosyltransferase involved in cell wall biosynthesis